MNMEYLFICNLHTTLFYLPKTLLSFVFSGKIGFYRFNVKQFSTGDNIFKICYVVLQFNYLFENVYLNVVTHLDMSFMLYGKFYQSILITREQY